MAGIERLTREIVDYLMANRDNILMDNQMKYCGPCGGMKASKVYRNPDSGHLGRLLDSLNAERARLSKGS